MYPVRLITETILLREFQPSDADSLFKVYGDAEATRHLSFEAKSAEQVADVVSGAIESATVDPRSVYMIAIEDCASGELIGAARLGIEPHQTGQIGFALRPDQWGQGKGTGTVLLLQHLGFKCLGLHRIWGARSPVNEASSRTMLGAGMIEEGTIRGHLFTRGAWRDSVVHSILSDEYMPSVGRVIKAG
jgi:[ribosomal protein S5]-alanine N-acetyltransferase